MSNANDYWEKKTFYFNSPENQDLHKANVSISLTHKIMTIFSIWTYGNSVEHKNKTTNFPSVHNVRCFWIFVSRAILNKNYGCLEVITLFIEQHSSAEKKLLGSVVGIPAITRSTKTNKMLVDEYIKQYCCHLHLVPSLIITFFSCYFCWIVGIALQLNQPNRQRHRSTTFDRVNNIKIWTLWSEKVVYGLNVVYSFAQAVRSESEKKSFTLKFRMLRNVSISFSHKNITIKTAKLKTNIN